MNEFLNQYFYYFIILMIGLGVLSARILFMRSRKARQISDLTWIVFGGLGVGAGVLFSSLQADRSQVERQAVEIFRVVQSFNKEVVGYIESVCREEPMIGRDYYTLERQCLFVGSQLTSLYQEGNFENINAFATSEIKAAGSGSCEAIHGVWRDDVCKVFLAPNDFFELSVLDVPIPKSFTRIDVYSIDNWTNSLADNLLLASNSLIESLLVFNARVADLKDKEFFDTLRMFALLSLAFAFPMRVAKSIADLAK